MSSRVRGTFMKIRRYYGHDCDSVMGFNNGYYIDDKPLKVKGHSEAMKACLDALIEYWTISNDDLFELDNGYEFIIAYYDPDGNEITRDQFLDNNDNEEYSYRYVYVTYELE
jgi:hypothetical protein